MHGPGQEPWEVHAVTGEGTSLENRPADCRTGDGCTNDCCVSGSADTAAAVDAGA